MEIIKIENGQLSPETTNQIKQIVTQMKSIKEQYDGFTAKLLEAMEQARIIKIDDKVNGLLINYIAETDRETFDSKKFKEDFPDLYDEYTKFSKVKSSVRIKVN